MTMRSGTLVVAIGVGTYESQAFTKLDGTRADLENIRRLFMDRGLPPSNLLLIPNEQAVRRNCLSALRVWAGRFRLTDLRLFVFFSGHGLTIEETGINTSVLLTHDADPEDPAATGIRVQDLAEAISRSRPVEVYFFIDACEVGSVHLFEKLDFGQLSGIGSRVSFGMFAAPGNRARESLDPNAGGFFTQTVVRALSTTEQLSCSQIADLVAQDLQAIGCPTPESLLRGNARIKPMEGLAASEIAPITPLAVGDVVLRPEACRSIIEQLALGIPVWLWGPSGRGKTLLAKHIGLVAERAVIVSSVPPRIYSQSQILEQVMDQLATEIAEQSPALFPSGRAPVDGLLGALSILAASRTPIVLAVDHLDRLDPADLSELATLIVGSGLDELILIGRAPSPPRLRCHLIEAPLLSESDVARFVAQYGPAMNTLPIQSLTMLSGGSPLRLRDFLASQGTDIQEWFDRQLSEDERSALDAVEATGGFVDIDLFSRVMQLNQIAVRQLIGRGLIQISDECFVAHDSVADSRNFTREPERDERALTYWILEIQASNATPRAARSVVQLLGRASEVDIAFGTLPEVIEELRLARDLRPLRSLVDALSRTTERTSPGWARATIALAGVFVHSVHHDDAARLLYILRGAKTSMTETNCDEVDLLESERLWWHGDFNDAISLLNSIDPQRHVPEVLLSRGIASWFLGHWREADRDFGRVIDDPASDERTLGWSQIMLASSLGLRGLELQQVRELFRDGIQRLTRVSDDIGVAIGWGNLGEISWKVGRLEDAELQLRKGIAYAREVCGPQILMEMYRSLVEVKIRTHGPWSSELSSVLTDVENLYDESMGTTAQMQLWNTLASVAVMRGDTELASDYIGRLIPLTSGNSEYHIYTLANNAAVLLLTGRLDQSEIEMSTAAEMSRRSGNDLALSQIRDNMRRLVTVHANLSSEQIRLAIRLSRDDDSDTAT
ncbi:caspase family protein [Nocardia sp. NPDC051052]|uniref:caspase family protein n=1 Tax=Nocardia sp. NPDC051052 TaxID=3364322 RepID=UPI00378F989F